MRISGWKIRTPAGEFRAKVQVFGPRPEPEEAARARSVWFFASCKVRNLDPLALDGALQLITEIKGSSELYQRARMDSELAERLVRKLDFAVTSGLIRFERIEWSAPPSPRSVEEPEEAPAPEVTDGTFDLQVVLDGDGSGVGQLNVGVKTQGEGEFRAHRTDGGGGIHVEHVVRGTADLRSEIKGARLDQSAVVVGWGTQPIEKEKTPTSDEDPPIRNLLEILNYRVRNGDTPASVAGRANMSWDELAYFNWGTKVPEEIQRHLAAAVGCRKKAEDGSFVFSSDDQPGIIRIPKPFSRDGLRTDEKNVLRVRRAQSTGFDQEIVLLLHSGESVVDRRFVLEFEDDSTEQGTTAAGGRSGHRKCGRGDTYGIRTLGPRSS